MFYSEAIMGMPETVELLAEAGANVNVEDSVRNRHTYDCLSNIVRAYM